MPAGRKKLIREESTSGERGDAVYQQSVFFEGERTKKMNFAHRETTGGGLGEGRREKEHKRLVLEGGREGAPSGRVAKNFLKAQKRRRDGRGLEEHLCIEVHL